MLAPGDYVGRAPELDVFQTDHARYLECADFMPIGWSADLIHWASTRRSSFVGGPGVDEHQNGWHLAQAEEHYPRVLELGDQIRQVANIGLNAIELDELDIEDTWLELWISCRGEGQAFHWHTDRDFVPEEKPFHSRALAFCYYAHTSPRRFMGGELEFPDGTTVAPTDNTLVFFDPNQVHRVRHVHACPQGPSSGGAWPKIQPLEWVDHRWNVSGWVHRLNPEGSRIRSPA